MLELTSGSRQEIIAIDGTGFSRTNPSYHYLKRINGVMPKIPVKLSAALNPQNRKFCAGRVRVLPAHDIKDAKYLLSRVHANKLVADKGYDANWLHNYCYDRNVEVHIPIRSYGKSIHNMWSKRRLAVKNFDEDTYHQRELIESGFGILKRRFGSSVNSKRIETISSEIYGKMLCHNLFIVLLVT
jgi:hypothetical protein